MKQNKWKHLKFEKYIFVLLLAIELIMSFTFLGFIHIDPISLTTALYPDRSCGMFAWTFGIDTDRIGIWTSKYV